MRSRGVLAGLFAIIVVVLAFVYVVATAKSAGGEDEPVVITSTSLAPPTTVAPTTVVPTTAKPTTTTVAPTTTTVVAIVPPPVAPPPVAPPPVVAPVAPAGSVEAIILAAAGEFGVDGNLLLRIMRCESGLNPLAVNRSSGALGLGQHLPRYWSGRAAALGYPYESWSDPTANARVSAKLLAEGGPGHWRACL
jgi:hypothetical protein